MEFIKLFNSFNTDNRSEEEVDTYMSRKEAFKKLGGLTKKVALASLPVAAFTVMPKMAFARAHDVIAVLKFALTLERLEYQFYIEGVNSGIISSQHQNVFMAIREHERIHVELLEATIQSLGGSLDGVPSMFDYTADGVFPSPFGNYQLFLALSQAFEDTGVRAYKGQAPNLMENDDLLKVALQIHAVEARHASQVRRIRGRKGWITEEDYDGIDGFGSTFMMASSAVYAGEKNTMHVGVEVTDVTTVPVMAVREAWDEPLSMQMVVDIVTPFIVS
ncbi:ferritin-like domain-containing protein [Pontibacter diazotrophicus]|uniref:Ferritin-like domain-containing protein n=1 Tax=Pontibacter diazotrophicus TaxID=1400979 RepID=A0A3D8LCL9_9BACT|nr:ferritin-like domain-containing protein [Pontibacter diazotrophicus]RDV15024.1 ferritin-like domain-containing protein [Pontibacter diazotrophicus]